MHIDELHEIFILLYFFQQLIAYQYQLIVLILFLSFLKLLVMLIQWLEEIVQDLTDNFLNTFS